MLSPWLFILYKDGVIRELSARIMCTGVKLEHIRHEREMTNLFYAHDTVLIANSDEKLQILVNVVREVCWRGKLKVNISKNKVMVASKNWKVCHGSDPERRKNAIS